MNYFLLISFLPAYLVIQFRYLNPWLVSHLPSSFWYCFPTFSYLPNLSFLNATKIQQSSTSSSSNRNDTIVSTCKVVVDEQQRSYLEQVCSSIQGLLHEVLPIVLIQGRFVWIFSLSIVLIMSAAICVTQLRLPQYNPLQLFVDSNPHEYYDNYAESRYFNLKVFKNVKISKFRDDFYF